MTDYIYRIDTQESLRKIVDRHFRARRWNPKDQYTFPHKLLKEVHSSIASTEALYRICFYTTQDKAETSLSRDYQYLSPAYMLRCRKHELLDLGFKESWDDGFKEGYAYLFWISEILSSSNEDFSTTALNIDLFDIWKDSQWHPLSSHLAQTHTTLPSLTSPDMGLATIPTTPEKRSWWKFW